MLLWAIIIFCVFCGIIRLAVYKRWNLFLLIVCGIGFLPFFILTIISLFSESNGLTIMCAIMSVFFGWCGLAALFRSRCPKCKKFFTVKQTGKNLIQMGQIYKNDAGDKKYQDNLYEIKLQCKKCNFEWTKNKTEQKEIY